MVIKDRLFMSHSSGFRKHTSHCIGSKISNWPKRVQWKNSFFPPMLCSTWDLKFSNQGSNTCLLQLEAQSLNLWSAREVQEKLSYALLKRNSTFIFELSSKSIIAGNILNQLCRRFQCLYLFSFSWKMLELQFLFACLSQPVTLFVCLFFVFCFFVFNFF